ncbi:mechanosensitive ion channel family protein [Marinilongibacter aquaticus]|uniref:mechanosensitive ion channel family protein n=1 Tax=Marinilongibacter aquaticus TaxID=2975157 RepID=UPI0021BDE84F|nr:mechanosensitive ion channel family protein [Marinilongibacter aquaticus]UBM60635.1 mechanosensitive ion channel family protein [Marinilongibacter aquaticus]
MSILSLVVFIGLRLIVRTLISRQVQLYDFHLARAVYVRKFFDFIFFGLLLVVNFFIWDFSFKSIFASFFAVAGVALFANWSLLSNVTASVILFFNYPIKIGSKVKIIDGNDSVMGKVKDLSFFSIQIEDESGNIVSYPNNLALQKGIVDLNPHKDEF